eukprot:scaffold114268_cov37-Cyclotella_meneghiniana.AAC.8
MKFSSAAIIFFATLSIASAKVGTKSAKSSDGKSTKTNKSSKTSSPTKAPVTSFPTKAPATLSPTSAPGANFFLFLQLKQFAALPVLFPTSSPVQTCPSQPTCTDCSGFKCKSDADCCASDSESCGLTASVCYDNNAPSGTLWNCTITCDDPNNRTQVLEQCAGLGIPDNQIGCSGWDADRCIDSTILDAECEISG